MIVGALVKTKNEQGWWRILYVSARGLELLHNDRKDPRRLEGIPESHVVKVKLNIKLRAGDTPSDINPLCLLRQLYAHPSRHGGLKNLQCPCERLI